MSAAPVRFIQLPMPAFAGSVEVHFFVVIFGLVLTALLFADGAAAFPFFPFLVVFLQATAFFFVAVAILVVMAKYAESSAQLLEPK